ncbi:cell morphogenesis N-terminal-domain-containing protein [Gorgonomyces haynaldii]|nr:cell morphogenesis N-terminal-domain-containing protein [Gorgonomyces haynaldii]
MEFPPREASLRELKELTQQDQPNITSRHIQAFLQVIFHRFVQYAQRKVKTLVYVNLDKDEDLSQSLMKGNDTEFDNILSSLSASAKHCPKVMIDSIMFWRKSKTDDLNLTNIPDAVRQQYPNMKPKELEGIIKERKSLISNFILCRALIEIVQHLGTAKFPHNLGDKLEDMVFGQLKNADPDLTARSLSRQANFDLFSELIGTLSLIRFSTVSDRFITEIGKGGADLKESKHEMMIWSMRFLKLQLYPMSALEETVDFLEIAGELFQNATGRIKYAYVDVFMKLLDPIARVATAEVNLPAWYKTIEIMYPVALKLVGKPKPYTALYPFLCTLLCVSRREYFLKNWTELIDLILPKLRERGMKEMVMSCMARLVWVYLFRCWESPASLVEKKIDSLVRVLTPPSKSLHIEYDIDLLMRVIYYMLAKYPEYVNENVIRKLLKSDGERLGDDYQESFNKTVQKAEQLVLEKSINSEKTLVALRSFLLLIADVEDSVKGDDDEFLNAGALALSQSHPGMVLVEGKLAVPQPAFPDFTNPSKGPTIEELEKIRCRETNPKTKPISINSPISPDLYARIGSGMRDTLGIVNETVGKILTVFDQAVGNWYFFDTPSQFTFVGPTNPPGSTNSNNSLNRNTSRVDALVGLGTLGLVAPALPTGYGSLGNFGTLNDRDPKADTQRDRVQLDLLLVCLDSIPRFSPAGLSPSRAIEIIANFLLHTNPDIASAASRCLNRLAQMQPTDEKTGYSWQIKDETIAASTCRISTSTVLKIVFARYGEFWTGNTDALFRAFKELSQLYLSGLKVWLDSLKKQEANDMKLESVMETVESIEQLGLLFLSQQDASIRQTAIDCLQMALEFQSCFHSQRAALESQKEQLLHDNQTLQRLANFHGGRGSLILQRSASIKVRKQLNDPRFESRRLYDILLDASYNLVNEQYEDTFEELQRAEQDQKQQRAKVKKSTILAKEQPLIYVATSEGSWENAVWNRCVPELLRIFVEQGNPNVFKLISIDIWNLVKSVHPLIINISEATPHQRSSSKSSERKPSQQQPYPAFTERKTSLKSVPLVSREALIAQWKSYLIFLMSFEKTPRPAPPPKFLENPRDPSQWVASMPAARTISTASRSSTDSNQSLTIQSIDSLLEKLMPLLGCKNGLIRQAVAKACGSLPPEQYPLLLNKLQSQLQVIVDDARVRATAWHDTMNRDPEARKLEHLRTEVTQLLALVSDFVEQDECIKNGFLMRPIGDFVRAMHLFLSKDEVQQEWDHQITRLYFCILIERLFNKISSVNLEEYDYIAEIMPFKLRLDLFNLFQSWCGHGIASEQSREREQIMMTRILDSIKDMRERANLTATMDQQRKKLITGALSAMACLLKGPITSPSDPGLTLDLTSLIVWINSIILSTKGSFRHIANAAIVSLMTFNATNEQLTEELIKQCYVSSKDVKVTNEYFLALVEFVSCQPVWQGSISKYLCLAIYQIGSEFKYLRTGAARLFLAIDRRVFGDGQETSELANDVMELYDMAPRREDMIQDNDDTSTLVDEHTGLLREVQSTYETAAITSTLPVVYKYAQTMVSQRLANERPEYAYEIVSELVFRIRLLSQSDLKQTKSIKFRDLLSVLSPWLKTMDLQGDFQMDKQKLGTPEKMEAQAKSYIVLNNLMYLTVTFGDLFVNEIENMWVSLVEREDSKPQETHKRLTVIVDYLVLLILDKRNPNLLHFAKMVIVCLCRTQCCTPLFDIIMSKFVPQTALPVNQELLHESVKNKFIPPMDLYCASIDEGLKNNAPRANFTTFQIYFILLVDVAIEVGHFAFRPHLPLVLHLICVQLDHIITFVCEQSRALLVNLVQAIRPTEPEARQRVDAVLAALNMKEGKRPWVYEDVSPTKMTLASTQQLSSLALELLDIFQMVHPNLRQEWGEMALKWGTSCSIRHIACRSLQLYRTMMPEFSQRMLSDLLHSLALAISDDQPESQGFSIELLDSLYIMVSQLDSRRIDMFPQLFWASVAAMLSTHDWEFVQALKVLSKFLELMTNEQQEDSLLIYFPTKWRGQFAGVLPLLMRGFYSKEGEGLAIGLLNRMLFVHDRQLVGQASIMYLTCAAMPRLMQGFEADIAKEGGSEVRIEKKWCLDTAAALSEACAGNPVLSRLFSSYANERFRSKIDFLKQYLSIIRDNYFPEYESKFVAIFVKMLSNQVLFYRRYALQILAILFSESHLQLPFEQILDQEHLTLEILVEMLQSELHEETTAVIDALLSSST